MTDSELKHLYARVSADVHRRAEIDIADIRAQIPFDIEHEVVEIMSLEDELNSDEVNLKRYRKVIK